MPGVCETGVCWGSLRLFSGKKNGFRSRIWILLCYWFCLAIVTFDIFFHTRNLKHKNLLLAKVD